MNMWTQGIKKTFVRITSPKKDVGISTLKRDKELWNFFPKINKVIKIPPSMMMGSWMGSDFTNDDMVKEATLLDDYNAKLINEDDKDFYHIELKPKEQTVTVWGKIELRINKISEIVDQEIFYSEKNEKIRVMELKDVKNLGGKMIPATIVLTPVKRPGQFTIIRYLKATFDTDIKNSIFTRKNLQKRR